MSRPRALVALLLLLAACGDDGKSGAAAGAPETGTVAKGTIGSGIDAAGKIAAAAKEADAICRGVLKSFDEQTYDPRREGFLEALDGEITFHADGKEGRCAFAYDVAKPASQRLKLDASSLPAGFPADVSEQAQRWVNLTCLGAYSYVAYFVPPARLILAPCKDPESLLVVAPAHRTPLNCSYVVEKKRELVTRRGEWTDALHKFVTDFEWENVRGRWFLKRTKTLQGEQMDTGPVADFAFDERDGPFLLRNVRVTDGVRAYDATFTYKSVRRRSR